MIFSFFKKPEPRKNSNNKVIIPPAPSTAPPVKAPKNQPLVPKDVPWMYPKNWKYIADPDGGKASFKTKDGKPEGVVIHHTATYNLNSTVQYFKDNAVDVHFLIGHDGKVIQMVQCNKDAAHAGTSSWNGRKNLNGYYIGIEVINIGWLTKKGDKFYDGYDREWKGKVRERKVLGYKYWEPFTDEQEKTLQELLVWLTKIYNIDPKNIAAHYEVSPGRKNDPAGGLSISMNQLREQILHLKTQ